MNSSSCSFLYIFLLIIIIGIVLFCKWNVGKWNLGKWNVSKWNYEEFVSISNNKKKIVLLGDSILHNDSYVYPEKNILDLIVERKQEGVIVYSYAKDGATISEVFKQVTHMPSALNSGDTCVFLSAGGNDILLHDIDISWLQSIFEMYSNLVKSIRNRFPKARLFLVDIYLPLPLGNLPLQKVEPNLLHLPLGKVEPNLPLGKVEPNLPLGKVEPNISLQNLPLQKVEENSSENVFNYVHEWNERIYKLAKTVGCDVLKISNLLRDESDFVNHIEPSSSGGGKIVQGILNSLITIV